MQSITDRLIELAHRANQGGSAMLPLDEARWVVKAMVKRGARRCGMSWELRQIHTYELAHTDGWSLRVTVDPQAAHARVLVMGDTSRLTLPANDDIEVSTSPRVARLKSMADAIIAGG